MMQPALRNDPIAGAMYDRIGEGYSLSRRADANLAHRVGNHVRANNGARYLDLACGSGGYTQRLIRNIGGAWDGLDKSKVMLEQADALRCGVSWRLGCAEALPYDDATFDGMICINAIHFFEIEKSVAEACRVLKRGGKLVLFFAASDQVRSYWLQRYFPQTIAATVATMPRTCELQATLSGAGFAVTAIAPYFVMPDLTDYFLYSGKQRPWLYFDRGITANISQFRRFCVEEELSTGLEKLQRDLTQNDFAGIADSYADGARGDCTIIAASRIG